MLKMFRMLNFSAPETQTPKIVCDRWKPYYQAYLKNKDYEGARGRYENYNQYVYTVNAIYAMTQGNLILFENCFSKLGKNYNDTVAVNFSRLPKNSYSKEHARDGDELVSFLELAEYHEAGKDPKCTNWLKEKYAPRENTFHEREGNAPKSGVRCRN